MLLLPAGDYRLQVEHPGFKRFSRSQLRLSTDQKMSISVKLKTGDLKETIQVTSEASLLESTVSAVG